MAFNSYGFLLAFLPLTVALYWGVARLIPGRGRLFVLILASLFFYILAARAALLLLTVSMLFNFLVSRLILGAGPRLARMWLFGGVAGNIALLLYFKYMGFFLANVGLSAQQGSFSGIILPLGISFYSFQQIAFLVDTGRGRLGAAHPLTYAASILFFPTILSGPITYYREFAPQAEEAPERRSMGMHVSVGLILVAIGLFKKVVIGDSLALWVDPLFAASAQGKAVSPLVAWTMVSAYLLQLYFDFSGYSDMAAGCARMFGLRLPLNFFSPLRVTSIIDWWRRWHMSLGRFVGDYIFTPLALPLTRFAMRRRLGRWPTHILAVLVPTFVSMFVIGAWHGGNWTFIVFGLLHATYMVVAESWRLARRKKGRKPAGAAARLGGNLATLLAVLVALIPFRSADMTTSVALWRAMVGMGAQASEPHWGALPGLGGAGLAVMMASAAAIIFLLPNSAQFLDRYAPSLDWRSWKGKARPLLAFTFSPGIGWGLALGVMAFLGLAFIARGAGGFLYVGY
ncbi:MULTISPECIES: MBOAT family O-acyltransferase [Sphingobium]|uniref:MBOAT family O-acyltransferase n=1 Tax=Sphingobium TaxID=165695 RepID=UPI000DB5FEC1|nr:MULTISPECIES: MBOAT family O-acyltransferase [Sphingobium]MDV3482241.1 MBOAT family O-acyltransferase [Sphingobium yanoikuyae]PZU64331.1 MAG: hypothetical protein DI540_20630 [Sphingobium sp.]